MPRCPNGHEQRFGIYCEICGGALSYKDSIQELLTLPKVEPDFGKVSVVTVGYPNVSVKADYVGSVSMGQTDLKTATAFGVAGIRGGSWLDFQKKYTEDLKRWLKLVGVEKTTDRVMLVDTTSPLSVLALAALPRLEHTAVVVVVADNNSTPVEQNTSYVAISLALKKGLPMIALTETFVREMLYFTEDSGFATGEEAVSRLLEPLIDAVEQLMDLLERDLKLGIQMHSMSAIVAGSKSVYGSASNVFTAQGYDVSMASSVVEGPQTFHALVFSRPDAEGDFEKSFSVYRNKLFKGAISAEFRFHDSGSGLYDAILIFGSNGKTSLQGIEAGYGAITKSMPELNADAVPSS